MERFDKRNRGKTRNILAISCMFCESKLTIYCLLASSLCLQFLLAFFLVGLGVARAKVNDRALLAILLSVLLLG